MTEKKVKKKSKRTKRSFEVDDVKKIDLAEIYSDSEVKSVWIKRRKGGKFGVACLVVY